MGLYRYYDPTIGKRRALKSVAIVNSDGTNEYTPNKIKAIEDDFDAHKADYIHLPYSIADGTNTYTTLINGISSLVEGMSVKIKFTNANTGASTLNINGLGAKPIQKSNGNALSSGNIKAGQIVHLVYTGSVFQLLGEGGEYGTAQAQDVLEGKTIGTEEGLVTGAMPNNGAINRIITNQNGQIVVPEGYHDGRGIVKAQFANLVSSNIRDGVSIGGVRGTFKGPDLTTLTKKTYYTDTINYQNSNNEYVDIYTVPLSLLKSNVIELHLQYSTLLYTIDYLVGTNVLFGISVEYSDTVQLNFLSYNRLLQMRSSRTGNFTLTVSYYG